MESDKTILLTVDVEDWFQVENFKETISFRSWSHRPLRVLANTHRILDLLDTFQSFNSIKNTPPKATFFILGWIARRVPGLVKEIKARGHEIGSHGSDHTMCADMPLDKLRQDLTDSRKLLEDITGSPVFGFRAPSFSINSDVLKVIEESGYRYDSSYNSFALNPRYGNVNLIGKKMNGIAVEVSENFFEIPITNLKIANWHLPLGGGGYFRLIPFSLFSFGIRMILSREKTYMLYLHPWELDPLQPRVHNASVLYKFRHYVNLGSVDAKIRSLIRQFHCCRFCTCSQYLKSLKVGQL